MFLNHLQYKEVSSLQWFNCQFFDFTVVQTNTNSVEIVFGILLLSQASNMQYETPSWCWTEAESHISQSAIWSPGETTHSFTTILVFHFQYIVQQIPWDIQQFVIKWALF